MRRWFSLQGSPEWIHKLSLVTYGDDAQRRGIKKKQIPRPSGVGMTTGGTPAGCVG